MVLVSLICVVSLAFATQPVLAKEKLLFLLVDGFRWDRLGYDMPALDRLERQGVRAEWLDGVFITRSAPSMFSIATGLYIEHHGVVHNIAFDPVTGERTNGWSEMLNTTWWFNWAGEPLWITAKSQGLKVGSFMYPGGQTPIDGILPDRFVPYTSETYHKYVNLVDRADVVFEWLYGDGLDVVFLYVGKLDSMLHAAGIGEEAGKVADEVNELVSYILDKMEETGVRENLNFIVASDHGMVNISNNKALSMFEYIDESLLDFVIADGGSVFQILPVDGALEQVYSKLKSAHPSINMYKKEEFPPWFHYADNPRNLPLIGYMDIGWTMYKQVNQSEVTDKAGHGYDNRDMTMKSSFYAQGPSFRKGYRARHFESVNIYPLMCELLDIVPAPNNGSRDNYKDMLVSEHPPTSPPGCGVSALCSHTTLILLTVALSASTKS
ncbi:ectonucleotide pyrophosphatase/phosphodiesterase family member 7-like [Acanthaster planci]|uniref:Ectonucleotide pyrophosphatase/phosphodiesterase family member 7-like n=1 Tax=Acanthaster planci TaxID=133434 RepID=A0A8B7YB54_ACAPL|nr:ectonucleotide pyrophosphatase/phosphodiesterase family member 7-like [Acanthaster planci]